MSVSTGLSITEELSLPQEEGDDIPYELGLYIGERNPRGERDGRGWAILPNGDQYDGHYRHGRRHGTGLYVFKGGARYYGRYRCGRRSGRGVFIYPDGSMYEGNWRKNTRHGKGRYCYANGDMYTGDWYYGERHGVGTYCMKSSDGCCTVHFKGTWVNGKRLGPFQIYFDGDEQCGLTLHGASWNISYPYGPAVFTLNQQYMLLGYFKPPEVDDKYAMMQTKRYTEESELFAEEGLHDNDAMLDDKLKVPSLFYAQEIACYDFSQLPQEPVPLPVSDSELSVCSLSSAPSQVPSMGGYGDMDAGEGEEAEAEGEVECMPCECECNDLSVESERCEVKKDPCAIEITVARNKCGN